MVTLKTTFADGEKFYAGTTSDTDKLNGITNAVNLKTIHRKVYSSAAEVAVTGNLADTAKTFDLTAPVNAIITKITMTCELKSSLSSASYFAEANLKINGTNLGTLYMNRILSVYPGTTGATVKDDHYLFVQTSTTEPAESDLNNQFLIAPGDSDTYWVMGAECNQNIKVLDATTTFTVRLGHAASAESKIKNVVIEVIYVEAYTED